MVHGRAKTAVEVMTNYIAAMSRGEFETGFGYFADDVVGLVSALRFSWSGWFGRHGCTGQRRR